MQLIIYKIW